MKFELNGVPKEVSSSPLTSLLRVLREELEVTSVKAGCEAGGCGACTVLIDGQPRRSCLTPVVTVEGSTVTTLEGLGDPEQLSPVQQAFIHHYASQCGFCTPGMVMAATAYLAGGGTDDREAIREALAGHVCRCTGYHKIIEAVAAAANESEFDLSMVAEEANVTVRMGGR